MQQTSAKRKPARQKSPQTHVDGKPAKTKSSIKTKPKTQPAETAVVRKAAAEPKHNELFVTGRNCRQVATATHASMLVDCANYYRAVHQAICKAQHSVFILGWDIDSRIELLRGDEAKKSKCPSRLFDLIQWKSAQQPDVMIYLNRWDYSVFMAADRENFSEFKWRWQSRDNVFYRFDDQLPLGASHHQKIIVVDDEIAFCGGMDIAMGRWDHRSHHARNPHRVDPVGTLKTADTMKFGPYHDVQMVVSGEAAQALAVIARERWLTASGNAAMPLRKTDDLKTNSGKTPPVPPSWPTLDVDFHDVGIGIALTLPAFKQQKQTQQIEKLYLDMIAKAEHFIYMENQFFTYQKIAKAVNKRLKERPELQVLMLSCWEPDGIMERKSMWYGRVLFRDIVEAGGVADRVVLAYPISREKTLQKPVRIHSKLMIVDDQYLRVGSSNINNRSMSLDSECDLVIAGHDTASRTKIRAIRNDLIREHTGREVADIEKFIQRGDVQAFLQETPNSTQHLRRINDERYRHERFTSFAIRFADPSKPILPAVITSRKRIRNKGINIGEETSMPARLIFALLLVAAVALLWKVTPLAEYASPEKLMPMLEAVRNTSWAIPVAIAVYVIGTLIFFPHVVMTGTIVILFPPVQAFFVAMVASLISGAIGFLVGRKMGEKALHALIGDFAGKIAKYAKQGGVVGLTLLRMVPVAPYTVVNLALGMMMVPFGSYMLATFLGMLPGTVVSAYLGHSVVELWRNPDGKNLAFLGIGILVWIGVILATHFLAKRWHHRSSGASRQA